MRHAVMRIATGFIEVAQAPADNQPSKRPEQVLQSLVVLVDVVDSRYQDAQTAGATIIAEPQDKPWGLRQYTAADLEGYRWEFSQHLRDVPPAEWDAQMME